MRISVEYLGRNIKQKFNVLPRQFWIDSLVDLPEDKGPWEARERRGRKLKSFEPYVIEGSAIHNSLFTGEVELGFVPSFPYIRYLVKTIVIDDELN